jgi:hypothetical protein
MEPSRTGAVLTLTEGRVCAAMTSPGKSRINRNKTILGMIGLLVFDKEGASLYLSPENPSMLMVVYHGGRWLSAFFP